MTDDAEDLLDEAKEQRRTNTEPKTETSSGDSVTLVEAVADALEEIDDKGQNPTIGFRDENLFALMDGLEATGELETIVRDAQAELGIDDDPTDNRSEACRLLVRVGLLSLDESIYDDAAKGRKEYAERKADAESF